MNTARRREGTKRRSANGRKSLNLALQGGGAHGAFAWGVLDRLLEDGRFDIEGISGTSAGAMNAACVADGYHTGREEGARRALGEFWHAIGREGQFSPVTRTPLDAWMGRWTAETSPGLLWMDLLSRIASPYDMNPFDLNPLRDIVAARINFRHVRACRAIALFIAATNVWNGKVRVFRNDEIDIDHVMASACLPNLFKAVEIRGVPYWDGGYMGNPVLFPFFYETGTEDILLVQINPVERHDTPRTAREITDRINEITFNASLLREFRAIQFVRRLLSEGRLPEERYKAIRMHRIAVPDEMIAMSASSKMIAETDFLEHLRDLGRQAATDWLDGDAQKVGREPGIDLDREIFYGLDGDWFDRLGEEAADEIRKGRDRERSLRGGAGPQPRRD